MNYRLLSLIENAPAGFQYRPILEQRELRRWPFALLAADREQAEAALAPFGTTLAGIIVTYGPELRWVSCSAQLFHVTVPPGLRAHLSDLLHSHLVLLENSQQSENRIKVLSQDLARAHSDSQRIKREFAQIKESLLEELSERRRAEEALRTSEERFRSIFEQSLDAIFNSIPDGTVINANPAACRMFGRTVQELCRVGRDGIMDTSDPRLAPALEERIRTGRISAELTCIRSNGERFPAEVSSVVTPGDPPRSFVIIRDITERKRAEQELVDKNSELERFTYSVSHDLKSPMITIQSFAGMIREDLEQGQHDRISDDLKKIVDASAKMGMLLDDLLKLSRAGQAMGPPTALDMGCLVENVLEQLAGPLRQKRVEVEVQSDLPIVHGDRQRIALVLQNLVENAIKYMGDQVSPRIGIGARQDGTETVMYVSDNGAGIDPRHHENIFGLFKKLNPKSQGTGVGLALVKRIIDVHGGRVWVESGGAGTGSTFCFTVPAANDCPP